MGHGFPYDASAYAEAAPILAATGVRVIVPYLRGFEPTGFLSADTPRSGEQAALGADFLALMDALDLERPSLDGQFRSWTRNLSIGSTKAASRPKLGRVFSTKWDK